MEGFIQLQKKICEWEWYTDIPTCKLFLHVLLKCNYKEAKWKGQKLNPWEFITSIEHLSLETWLTRQQVRTAIEKLKRTWEVTHQATNNYTILGLNNWETYNTPNNQRITNKQQTNNKRITTANKEYNEKKEKTSDTSIFQTFIDNPENESITFYLIKYFLLLDWKPAKDETIETLRKWVKEVFEENEVKDAGKMKSSIEIWYDYWKEEKRPKNIKSTFRSTIKFSIPWKNK